MIHGDCIDVLKTIPDNSIDLVLTDPPYGIKYKSNFRKKQFSEIKNDDNSMRFVTYAEFFRIMKQDTVAVVFASWKNVADDIIELKKYFDIKNIIVWWKHGGGIGDLKHTLSTDYELAIVCHKGKAKIRGKREGSVWECKKVNPNTMIHPTQKPDELIAKIIEKFSDKNNVVLDPFLGSGSTGVACVNTGRRFIGIELEKKYFDIAKQRIDDAVFSLHK